MKKILNLTTIAVLFIFSFSCEKGDSELNIESAIEQGKTVEYKLQSGALKSTICDIIGTTVIATGIAIVDAGTTANYSYTNNTGTSSSVNWILNSVKPLGSATVNQSGTVSFSSSFISATLLADGTSGTALPCTAQLDISARIISPPLPSCSCPSPIIYNLIDKSGGHPDWRFRVKGVSSGGDDQITWSIDYGDAISGVHLTSAIFRPNAESIAGFTVFCKVVRTCPDGSTKERTAYYTNYYGNSYGTGTTGFTTPCNVGFP